jgi:hypothetical protein
MLKKEITFEDFNGEKTTETIYFNLTKSEMIEMEVGYEDGLDATIKRIIKTNDRQNLIKEFKKIILAAYGEKSEDGKKFVKSDAIREAFQQTAAYDAMFMELATNAESAASFMKGILPKDMAAEVARLENETVAPPQSLAAPTPPSA